MIANGTATELELRRDLAKFSKWLYRLGFMPGSSGNLSVRADADTILVTPTGCSKYLVKLDDMVLVDLEGRKISGSKGPTSASSKILPTQRSRFIPPLPETLRPAPVTSKSFFASGAHGPRSTKCGSACLLLR